MELFTVIGVVVAGCAALAAIILGGRWGWDKIPHAANHESDILHRLSEIVVALNAQTEILRKPSTEVGISNGYLLEMRHSLKDLVEHSRKSQEAANAPTLAALQEIHKAISLQTANSEHWFSDLSKSSIRSQDMLVHADVQGVIGKLDELQLFIQKQDASKIIALDAIVVGFDKFAKDHKQFMKALFDGGSISTVNDEESARLEKIERLMRTYGMDRASATQRVDGASVYEPNQGRGTMRSES